MTSSLVGSEMCIRDSDSNCHRPQRRHSLTLRPSMRERARLNELELWAVSYTHLTLPTICSV
eukprot:10194652-Prorocentrum_lima.AAC.1